MCIRDRNVGVITGSEITRNYGLKGLPEDTIVAKTIGHGGQSLGAWMPKGLTLQHTGDANDYVGKGLSGGKIVINAPNVARENEIIVGNVCFYGATQGEAYINGRAGERFCIRNSGVHVVVEGVGDHGLEYMTGGRVVILGDVGKNFGQGMSGGVSYIFPSDVATFKTQNQLDSLDFDEVVDEEEKEMLKAMIQRHLKYTDSQKAATILSDFDVKLKACVKVIPKDYKKMVQKIHYHQQRTTSQDEVLLAAFNDKGSIQETAQEERIPVY